MRPRVFPFGAILTIGLPPENFINNCFKVLLNNKHRIQEKVITVLKKPLCLVNPYLGSVLLKTITELRNFLQVILNFCKSHILFKNKKKLTNAFYFKYHILEELISSFVYKFQSGLYNKYYYCECVKHLGIKTGEDVGVSPISVASAV